MKEMKDFDPFDSFVVLKEIEINNKFSLFNYLNMNQFPSKAIFISIILFILSNSLFSQQNPDTVKFCSNRKLCAVIGFQSALYAGTLYGLNEFWYKNYPRSDFHFFNDSKEWLQMDKVGHFMTSYSIGRIGIKMMNRSGMSPKASIWYGGILGAVYLSTIEILDGYSSEWGFSPLDFTANTAGSFFAMSQEFLWQEQKISIKYSFRQSPYAKYRPNLLGKNIYENWLKDYNGQTYWLSVNIASFLKSGSTFPKWLNLAVGYGAQGMTGGESNPLFTDVNGIPVIHQRYRQYYLSFDIDLTKIPVKSKFLKSVFFALNVIKFPAPALEFNKNGIKANLLGF